MSATRRRLSICSAAIVLLVAVVFAPVRHHDFVTFDDHEFVVDNPNVNQGLTASGIRAAFTNAYAATGGPVTWLSHMVDVQMFGLVPGPHHVVNVALHALNAVFLLLVLWRLTGQIGRSVCVAALFAIHPLHVESVAWISERKDVLATTFWLLTIGAYVRYARQPGVARYLVVVVLLTLGLLAKPVLVTVPITLLLLDAWPLGRAPLSWSVRQQWGRLLLEKLPMFVPVGGATLLTVLAQDKLHAISGAATLPWSIRLANAVTSYAAYLGKMLWPANLAVFYPYPADIPVGVLVVSGVVLVAGSVAAWRFATTRPYVAVSWLWYLVTLTPMLGLVQVGSHAMADRFTYVPLIGIFIVIVWGLGDLFDALPRGRGVAFAIASAATIVCAVLARAQVETWRDSETMWRHAMAVTTGNFRAHAGVAGVEASRGEVDAAITDYREAVRLAPDGPEWTVNLALLLAQTDRVSEAVDMFQRAVQLNPDDAESHNNLGAMLARLGRNADAIVHYRRALEIKPAYPLAHHNLGLALANDGDLAGATRECLEAIRRSPSEGQWHYEVAVMLLRQGSNQDAVGHLQQAVTLQPQNQAARDLLAQLIR